jgi:signal transduction histidine kinase
MMAEKYMPMGKAEVFTLIAKCLAIAVIYIVLTRISNIFQTTELRATPWNPEAGAAVAAGALIGWPAIPVIFLTNMAVSFYDASPLPTFWLIVASMFHASIFAGSAAISSQWLQRLSAPSTNNVLQFIVIVAIITFMATLTKLFVVGVAFQVPPTYLARYLFTLTVGNLIGVLTVTPIFCSEKRLSDWLEYFRRFQASQYLALAVLVLFSFVVFGWKQTDEFKFFYLVFMPVIAFAIRDGFRGAVFSILASDVLMIIILLWQNFEPSIATDLQLLMVSLSVTGLILGATVTERQRVSDALHESHLRFQESQTALLQATRLSLASEMAGALAHELNQPLTAVRNFIRTVRRRLTQPKLNRQELFSDIDAAVAQVDSASNLIKSTRAFIKRGDINYAVADVNQCLDFTLKLVEREIKSAKITTHVKSSKDLPKVYGNEQQIQQVLINLIRNAKEAIVQAKSKQREIAISINPNSRVGVLEISVSDTGPGVSNDIRDSLFSPLHSSKPDGLGLGLSLCNSIVQSHGGEIWHDDSIKSGARFVFTLPTHVSKDSRL